MNECEHEWIYIGAIVKTIVSTIVCVRLSIIHLLLGMKYNKKVKSNLK
jgi:hypothetical protein